MKRWEVLTKLLKDRPHAFGVEVGVNYGETTCYLSRSLPGIQTIIGVDSYTNYPDLRSTADRTKSYARLLKNLSKLDRNNVSLIRLPSRVAANLFINEIFDWGFIDANHSYKYVRDDILLWSPKIKKGGIIAGHDYGNDEDRRGYGVRKAVSELFSEVTVEPDHVWWTIK